MSVKAAIHHKSSGLGLPAIIIAIGVGATSPPALAAFRATGNDSGGACSSSILSAKKACGSDADGSYWLAVGTCQNQPNATRRQACLTAAGKERDDANVLCDARLEARDDACDDLGEAAYDPSINPANFVTAITNRYFPLKLGTTFIYQGETDAGTERAVLRVQHRTATILGVECTQVRDTVSLDGEVTEDTLDWYAQDKQGNVWYFGESTFELENGRPVNVEGSWRGGVDGAKPGIIMKAHPNAGDVYRQEFLLGTAEDLAEVLSVAGSANASAASCHGNCVVTREFTPLEPTLNERKYYAPYVGFILEVDVATGDRLELIEIHHP